MTNNNDIQHKRCWEVFWLAISSISGRIPDCCPHETVLFDKFRECSANDKHSFSSINQRQWKMFKSSLLNEQKRYVICLSAKSCVVVPSKVCIVQKATHHVISKKIKLSEWCKRHGWKGRTYTSQKVIMWDMRNKILYMTGNGSCGRC